MDSDVKIPAEINLVKITFLFWELIPLRSK